MREAFVNINDVPTHILTWGNWIEESFSKKEIVLCITGNPGLPGFYTRFMATISETIGSDIPVWVIGHAGHDEPPQTSHRKVPDLEGNESKYNLDGQVQHKLEFIRQYVPKDVKIHLIGHSIGAWMTLELLKIPEIKSQIHQCYLLFPTIEHMAASSNGWVYINIVQRFWLFLNLLITIFSKLPTVCQVLIIYMYFFMMGIPRYFVGTALKYSRPTVLRKIVYLADDEMERVIEPDLALLEANQKILKLYYGASDGWAPVKYCHRMQERVPGLDAQVDIYQYSHAFVLRSSIEMGKLVSGWIMQNRVN